MSHFRIYSPPHVCPGCNITFQSADHVIEHLNSESSCWPQDSRTKRLAAPPAFICGGKPKAKGSTIGSFHPTSGYIYGSAENLFQLMEHSDFAHCRAHNTYYPFLDQEDWELGQFFIRRFIAEDTKDLLKLPWVSMIFLKLDVTLNLSQVQT